MNYFKNTYIIDGLIRVIDTFSACVGYNNSYYMFTYVFMFFTGLVYDVYVFIALKLGLNLDVNNKNFLSFRFWFGYALPVCATLISSGYAFYLLIVMDFNNLNPVIFNLSMLIIIATLVYISYQHIYLKKPLGFQFTVIQAFGIILSDLIVGVLVVAGMPFSIMLMTMFNMLVTLLAYMISKKPYAYVTYAGDYTLNLIIKTKTFFKLKAPFSKAICDVKRSYAFAMYSVLLISKTFIWASGVFFGPNKQFENTSLGFWVLVALSLAWFLASLRLLYYAILCVNTNNQRLTFPWEFGITYQLSPAHNVLTLLKACLTYYKIHTYRKFLTCLRNYSSSSEKHAFLNYIYLLPCLQKQGHPWLLKNLSSKYNTSHWINGIKFKLVRAQVRRYITLYACANVIIRPCVLLGKAWVSHQVYYPNLSSILNPSLFLTGTPSMSQLFSKIHQAVTKIVPYGAVSGITLFGVTELLQETCAQKEVVCVSAEVTHISHQVQNDGASKIDGEAQKFLDKAEKHANLACIHKTNPKLRHQYAKTTSEALYDLAKQAGLSGDMLKDSKGSLGMLHKITDHLGVEKVVDFKS